MLKGKVGKLTWDDCKECENYDQEKGCTVIDDGSGYTVSGSDVFCDDFKAR